MQFLPEAFSFCQNNWYNIKSISISINKRDQNRLLGFRSGGWLPPKEPQSLILPSIHAAVLAAQSCLTLYDPMDCSLPGSSVHGILQARILEWVVIPFSRGSSQPRNWTWVPCIAGRFFTIWATRQAQSMFQNGFISHSIKIRNPSFEYAIAEWLALTHTMQQKSW